MYYNIYEIDTQPIRQSRMDAQSIGGACPVSRKVRGSGR